MNLPTIKGGHTLLVNPGTVGGVAAPATYALGDLDNMEFTIYDVQMDQPETVVAQA
jgi:predicted phosphodiesterase